MKRLTVLVLVTVLVMACGQKAEQKPAPQTNLDTPSQPATSAKQPPPRPAFRQTDARVWVDAVTVAKGAKGSFKVHYYGVEPVRAMVIPLTYPVGMKIDSVSYVGSMVDYIATRPVRIDNQSRVVLMTSIPTTEPDIPAKEGVFATVFFSLGPDAVSGPIEEGFVPPGNYLTYVDTTSNLAEPQFEPGKVTIQ